MLTVAILATAIDAYLLYHRLALDVQDDYFASTGLPVSTVTPATLNWDYTSVDNQQKMMALGTAIEAGLKVVKAAL